MEFLFSHTAEIWNSFSKAERPNDPEISKLIDITDHRLNKGESLAFFKKNNYKNFEDRVLDIITEEGKELSSERLSIIVDYLEKTRSNKNIQKRFWIQTCISIFILTASILYLYLSQNTNPNTEKAVFGLIGTVLGYWLR